MNRLIRFASLAVLVGCMVALTGCGEGGGGGGAMDVGPTGDYKNLSPHDKIFKATAIGDVETVKSALAEDANLIKARGIAGMTPLHSAAAAGQDAVVKYLLEQGADPNVLDDNSNNAAGAAMYEGHKKTAQIINDYSASK